MSKRSPLTVRCPECAAKPGHPCKNYQGKNCAPHRRRKASFAVTPPPDDDDDLAPWNERLDGDDDETPGRTLAAQRLLAKAPRRPTVEPARPTLGARLCVPCGERATWGKSPVCFDCLIAVDLVLNAAGSPVDPRQENAGALFAGRYRYKAVKCGKGACRRCPHYWYVYREWRAAGVARSTYLGPADHTGDAYERPQLRAAGAGFGR